VLPALERFLDKLSEESRQTVRENIMKIGSHKEKFFKFIQYHLNYKYPFIPDMDPDAALYQDGFFSFKEKQEINLFHQTFSNLILTNLNPDKMKIINKIKSQRIKILANRILARNCNNISGHTDQAEYRQHVNRLKSSMEKDHIIGYRNEIKFNRRQGLDDLETTKQSLLNPDQETKNMLGWLKKYIEAL